MPSIHPTEDPPLGWLVPCLAVTDLRAVTAFYGHLDLLPYGGDPDDGWVMLRNRTSEIHLFEGHIEKDLLNFRGGNVERILGALAARGLAPIGSGDEGRRTLLDPDGRQVFFDTSPAEAEGYAEGNLLTLPVAGDPRAGDGLDLGNFSWCLNCGDLARTMDFYGRLGFVLGGGAPEEGWAILARRDHTVSFGERLDGCHLALFAGMIPADTLNFRGGNVAALAAALQARGVDLGGGVTTTDDGGEWLQIEDPEGRPVLFDTTPAERLY